jgi:centromeric protein E
MNHTSSRSHCIFKINLRSKLQGSKNEICSSINLIDLAGSEGVAKSDIGGKRLKEGSSINKSLLSMYNVITKLNKKADFICFRESKLTRILQPYLGGNSLTAIICNINPLISNYNESVSTLRFAMCAGGIKNNVKINFKAKDNSKLIEDMENDLKAIEEEIAEVESRQQSHQDKTMAIEEEIRENREFILAGKENITSLENKLSEGQKVVDSKNTELEIVNKDTANACKMVEDYENKFEKLKNENIFEKIENM